ncbi:unnamed protein product [Paramecium sonneborni]|uniref:Uncharacterized protein n=1 Tax=Paramecium sonneborni TaxID=65129 RepID=A0A8S1KQ06_9CILI|nr:unnamed protein product [Paramecium sonneborni]
MILICKGDDEKFQFLDQEQDGLQIIVDLNSIEQQLDEGQHEYLQKIFEQVTQSNEFKEIDQGVKSQIEWANSLVQNYQNNNNNEQKQSELYNQLNTELINQRYPEVHQTNKLLDDNIQKIKARVQLLQLTEQRNILKTQSLEKNTQKIIMCKQNKFEKETQKERYSRIQRELIDKRKQEIQKQRELHQQILDQSKGKQGRIVQQRILQTREFKTRIQQDFHKTIRQVEAQNQKSYQRIKKMEQIQTEKIQKFLLDKQVFAQKNYQKKVEDEFQATMSKQDELEQLEKLEQQLLERIKVTQQMYQESSLRLETIKQQSYRLIGQNQL